MSELAYPLEDTSDFHDRPFFQESDVEEVPETPSKSPPAPFSPGASDPYSALDSRHRQPFYIEVPYLSPEQKDLYGPVPDVLVESDEELEPFELRSVVGEYLTGGVHYYYAANTSGGLIRRVCLISVIIEDMNRIDFNQ